MQSHHSTLISFINISTPAWVPVKCAQLHPFERIRHSNRVSVSMRWSVLKWQKTEVGKNNRLLVLTRGESLLC